MVKLVKNFVTVCLLVILPVALAKSVAWERYEKSLKLLEAKFSDPKLSEEQRVELLPRANSLLATLQELNLNEAEKKQKIAAVVSLLEAGIETDFANSMTSTIYYDYKRSKPAYMAEIGKIGSSEIRNRVIESFKMWEEFDRKKDDPEITGRPRSQ